MNKTYKKVVNLLRDNAYPIHPEQRDLLDCGESLQRIFQCNFQQSEITYELEHVIGFSLQDTLLESLSSSEGFIAKFNGFIHWYLENCILKVDQYYLMLNGDSHPGNFICKPEGDYVTIDYLSDFLVLTDDENRIYLGFLSFFKKYEIKTFEIISQLDIPRNSLKILKHTKTTDEMSDLSDELIIFSRDRLIENHINKIESDMDRLFQKILKEINYDISKDLELIKLI